MSKLRQIIREEIQKVNRQQTRRVLAEQFTLMDLEKHVRNNRKEILDNMKTYGWKVRDVLHLKNYRDVASLLGVDAKLLQHVDLEEYTATIAALL